MKTLFYILFVSAFAVFLSAQYPNVDFANDEKGGIQFFKGTWNEALMQAKKENKLIFLDIYATWCGPCRKLKAKTFSDPEVGTYYNSNFINVSFDGEFGEGIELARKYNVTAYPTLLFVDYTGKLIVATAGYHRSNEFIELGKTTTQH